MGYTMTDRTMNDQLAAAGTASVPDSAPGFVGDEVIRYVEQITGMSMLTGRNRLDRIHKRIANRGLDQSPDVGEDLAATYSDSESLASWQAESMSNIPD